MDFSIKHFRRGCRSIISRVYNRFVKEFIKLGSDRKIWDGIYYSKNDIDIKNNDWDYFTNWQFTEVRNLIEKHNEDPDEYFIGDRALFPLLVSIISKDKSEIKILDIGGGVSLDFLAILNCSKISTKLQYFIVDIPELIIRAQDVFKKYPQVSYLADYGEKCADLDIILFNSSLQYFDDYKKKITDIAQLNAKYIVFIRLSGGKFDSYISRQVNIPDVETPYWFVNIDELRNLLADCGYQLLYQSRGDCEYYQGNFPESYRMNRTWNLVFTKM